MKDAIREFLFGFSALFAIINPYGLAFIFLRRTGPLPAPERKALAARVAFYAFAVLVGSLFAGSTILGFFGISVAALRIAGGLVVAATGWAMLNEPADESKASSSDNNNHTTMAFFPLTVPLTTGPGTIATAIALGANRPPDLPAAITYFTFIAMAAAAALLVYHAYRSSALFSHFLGSEGTRVVTSLSAFLLLCVGVQIAIIGVSDAVNTLFVPLQHT